MVIFVVEIWFFKFKIGFIVVWIFFCFFMIINLGVDLGFFLMFI